MPQLIRRKRLKWLAVLQPVANQGKRQVIPTGDAVLDFDVVEVVLMQLLHNCQDNQ